MARFPLSEAEIARLAEVVAAGLAAHAEDFPSPPVPAERLQAALNTYWAAREDAAAASAQAVLRTAAKEKALQVLVDLLKSDLRYAENHARGDHIRLGYLGWGGRRPRTSREAPGEVRALQMLRELEGAVLLGWKQPVDGGPVAAYKVQRRRRNVGDGWTSALLLSRRSRSTTSAVPT